jgi:hypothetical protein
MVRMISQGLSLQNASETMYFWRRRVLIHVKPHLKVSGDVLTISRAAPGAPRS